MAVKLSIEPSLFLRYLVDSVEDGPLVSMPFRQFIYSLGSRSSAPGGGSASAAIGAMVSLVNWNENTMSQSAVVEFRLLKYMLRIPKRFCLLFYQKMA